MPLNPVQRQATLKSVVSCAGIELHRGKDVNLSLRPAPVGTGLVFVRMDISDRDNRVAVHPDAVIGVRQCTRIANAAGVEIATIEHLMAALAASGVDNLVIELDSGEVPALDGSSEPFLKMIEKAGIHSQPAPRRYIRVLKPVTVKNGQACARIEPAESLQLDVTIDFEDEAIGRQRIKIEPNVNSFRQRLASARTFARAHEVAVLQEAGFSLGGSYENAVVVDGDKILNPEGLRYQDEFVRHKALDLLGDLYVGGPILGRVTAVCVGHGLNHQLLLALFSDPEAWKFTHLATANSGRTAISMLEEIIPGL